MQTIILDRDGVINLDTEDGIRSAAEWEAIPGSLEAIAQLSQHGYRVIVAINQPGLARRKFTIEDLISINQKMLSHLAQYGGIIEAVFFCPCGPREPDCDCNKPKPGLLKEIAARLRISLEGVPCVGDKLSDLQAAQAAGAQPILVRTGGGQKLASDGKIPKGTGIHESLAAYTDHLLKTD